MNMKDCIAVIFSSELAGSDPAYGEAAQRMHSLAQQIPGFLGIESYRDGARGVSISYWRDEEAIRAWREHPEHLETQARGRGGWYSRYTLRVARIFRENHFEGVAQGVTFGS